MLSRRVESILLGQDSRAAEKRGLVINAFFSLLSLALTVVNAITLWNGKYQFGLPVRSVDCFLFIFTPLGLFGILLSAFHKLNKLPEYFVGQLQRKSVAVVLISNGAYALFLPLTWIFKPSQIGLAPYTVLIVLSYATALLGLIQVTHMMCTLVDIQLK